MALSVTMSALMSIPSSFQLTEVADAAIAQVAPHQELGVTGDGGDRSPQLVGGNGEELVALAERLRGRFPGRALGGKGSPQFGFDALALRELRLQALGALLENGDGAQLLLLGRESRIALGRHDSGVLVADLAQTRTPYFCPHGRPIVSRVSLHDIRRELKRTW